MQPKTTPNDCGDCPWLAVFSGGAARCWCPERGLIDPPIDRAVPGWARGERVKPAWCPLMKTAILVEPANPPKGAINGT